MLTPNPNECHSMLTSDIRGIYPYPPYLYIYILPPISIYIYIYIASESSMILSILRLNPWIIHVNNPWLNYGWLWSAATGEQHTLYWEK